MTDSGDRFKNYYLNKDFCDLESLMQEMKGIKQWHQGTRRYCVAIKWVVELTWEDSYGGCWEGETLTTFDSVIRVGAATVIKMNHNRCETSVWRLQKNSNKERSWKSSDVSWGTESLRLHQKGGKHKEKKKKDSHYMLSTQESRLWDGD